MATRLEESSIHRQVAEVIDRLRPAVQRDGGDLELVRVDARGIVEVRLHGACVGCPSSHQTLTEGVERNLRDKVPGVSKVVRVG